MLHFTAPEEQIHERMKTMRSKENLTQLHQNNEILRFLQLAGCKKSKSPGNSDDVRLENLKTTL